MISPKTHIYACILFFLFLACKSTSLVGQKNNNKYYTVFSELEEDNSSLDELYQKLKDHFNLCGITDSQKKVYKKYPKIFLEELSKNFENKAFLKVKNLKILSVLSLKEKEKFNDLCISIEEWDFEKTKDATLVFNSLKEYREKEIKFNTINWIWLIYKNHLYRISSDNHSVNSVEMMKVKKYLTVLLKKKGSVDTLVFYE